MNHHPPHTALQFLLLLFLDFHPFPIILPFSRGLKEIHSSACWQEMERDKKKRGREEEKEADEEETRRRDFKEKAATRREFLAGGVGEDCEPLKLSDSFQPLGVFEFPWEEEETLVSESVWKSHDVFYSSLLEGCCSVVDDGPPCQIPAPEPEEESWPLEGEETDGVDCIWSCVLSQPLSAGATKLSSS